MNIDYIIIGQGIAGTVLANEFHNKGKSFVIVDNGFKSSSSIIAAGLYNPVVFKRFVKSWMADELLPVADEVYCSLEEKLGTSFYRKQNIYKIFASEEEDKLWQNKSEDNKFMSSGKLKNILPGIHDPFGGGVVVQSGSVNVSDLLRHYRGFLKEKNLLMEESFLYSDLKFSNEEVTWKQIKAKKIIFCEGHKAVDNPFFNWLPFKLTKGELITIKIENFSPEMVINKGVFVLPLGDNLFKVGATYEWNDLSELPTEKGQAELVEKLKKIITIPFDIISHNAGIRPTVSDRRPLIGLHPEYKSLAIINGMGTKGVMLAPYFARQFSAFLDGGNKLIAEVDIERYFKKYNIGF